MSPRTLFGAQRPTVAHGGRSVVEHVYRADDARDLEAPWGKRGLSIAGQQIGVEFEFNRAGFKNTNPFSQYRWHVAVPTLAVALFIEHHHRAAKNEIGIFPIFYHINHFACPTSTEGRDVPFGHRDVIGDHGSDIFGSCGHVFGRPGTVSLGTPGLIILPHTIAPIGG